MKQKYFTQIFYRVFPLLLAVVIFIGSPFTVKAGGNDVIIDAMKDELDRSMKSLKIEDMDKPYYLEYSLGDYWQWSILGSFGALTQTSKNHRRGLKVNLRVGDYALDNTGFIDRSSMFSSITGGFQSIAVEDEYNVLRRELWLATDRAYKGALGQMANKNAYLKTQVQEEEIPDFSKEKSVQKLLPPKTFKMDQAKWEKVIKDISAIFREFPVIHESHVEMQVRLLHKYFINSEGTMFHQPEVLIALTAHASTQAPDGMKLKHYIPFYATSFAGLPGEKELAGKIRTMAKELTALASAPVLEDYIGPLLFTGKASAEFFIQSLVPHLSGQRPPLSNMPQISQMISSGKLAQRLNRKVLPGEISIIDDPTRGDFNKVPLLGSYAVDDEGVLAQPVSLVEKGMLKNLLMSRRPRKEFAQSNGHGRAGLMGNPGAQISNLLITAEKGKTYKQLKEELLQLCQDQGIEFGIIIKTLDNPSITGLDDAMSYFSMASQSQSKITNPIMMYRVYAKDGREELVRGISISELSVSDLKDITAVGNDTYVMHRFLASGGGVFGGIFSLFTRGGRDMGIPTSIAAPSVLFEEVEFKKNEAKKKKPPVMSHPFFNMGRLK